MEVQYKHTIFSVDKDADVEVPFARTVSTNTVFGDFASAAVTSAAAGTTELETEIWKLAAVLFDTHELPAPYSSPSNIDLSLPSPKTQNETLRSRQRKDLLVDFWKSLIASEVSEAVRNATTPEDRALAYLTGGDLTAACKALVEGRDFKLATMVAQLPANAVFRETMDRQINAWDELNVTSEFSDVMRAMYGILAGRTMRCEGKSGNAVPIEDRSSSFYLSERFGMTWRRTFALRLFWGVFKEDDLAKAVELYAKDLQAGEPCVPEYDPLWSVLQLYVAHRSGHEENIGSLLDWYEALPADSDRLAFQFASLITSLNGADSQILDDIILNGPVLGPLLQNVRDVAKYDEQHSCALLFRAVFITLHVRSQPKVLHQLLSDNADLVIRFNCGQQLISKLGVPAKWIGEAQARAAKTSGDIESELEGLVLAGESKQAMERLFNEILPGLAIRGDLGSMKRVLGSGMLPFVSDKAAKSANAKKETKAMEKFKPDLDFWTEYLVIVEGAKGASAREGIVTRFKEELERRKPNLDAVAWRVMKGEVEAL
jgi:nuclear pore complex protein Nup98-Nup96